MSAASPLPAGPVAPTEPVTGSSVSARLHPALALAREWAGDGLVALVLSGSHAVGEGVWCEREGRPVTLSDLDVYAVLRDEAAVRAARERAAAARPGLAARLLEHGIAAPLEVAFLTRSGFARMPARPGSLLLARRGRVLEGDASVLETLPAWSPADISHEEIRLLLENRAFEILLAWPAMDARQPLARLQARHALLKAGADLATVLALLRGQLPEGALARMAWARAQVLPGLPALLPSDWLDAPGALASTWDAAAAWRSGEVAALEPSAAHAEWRAVARAWCAVWWLTGDEPRRDPWARALAVAARAPLRRRLRRAGAGPSGASLVRRARLALAGTPQHRINASAAVLLLAASSSTGAPALAVGALRALHALGVSESHAWDAVRADVVRAWDRVVLDGQRTGEGA